jgi:hypothetical protein
MPRPYVLVLMLCACAARPSDDLETDDPATDDSSTDGSTTDGPTTMPPATSGSTSLDDSAGSSTSPAMTTTVATTDTDATTDDPPEVSHAIDIQPIFDEHCVEACHMYGGEWPLMDLSPGQSYGSIVSITAPTFPRLSIIEPGDPEQSYLWHKINGTYLEIGGNGVTMPRPRRGMDPTVLTPEQFETIEQWILQGAPP